jgi:osmotically-inducible protein OsmY
MDQPNRKTDSQIQQDVARELAWDTRVSPTEVGIAVKNGVVTLTGAVSTWAKLRSAEEAAHRVAGVLDVANDLIVNPPGGQLRTDTDIAQAVRTALEWDVTVPDHQIRTTVSQGTVTLEGTVSYWTERADAERAVERLAGVKRVLNQIEVVPTEQVDVSAAHRAVEKALERHAEREAARIDLHAIEGTVNVAGIVQTWQEKEAVLGAVRGTRGVREVEDHLRVQPV